MIIAIICKVIIKFNRLLASHEEFKMTVDYMHHTPGRLRLKGRHFNCHGEVARRAVTLLQGTPGIEQVRFNRYAGSLIVHYNPVQVTHDDLMNLLEVADFLNQSARVQRHKTESSDKLAERVTGLFGKALVGALAQRTAGHLIGKLW